MVFPIFHILIFLNLPSKLHRKIKSPFLLYSLSFALTHYADFIKALGLKNLGGFFIKRKKKERKKISLLMRPFPLSPSQTNYAICGTIVRETAEQKVRGSNQTACFCLHNILGIRTLPYLYGIQHVTSSH